MVSCPQLNHTPHTETYTLSLHDALPISGTLNWVKDQPEAPARAALAGASGWYWRFRHAELGQRPTRSASEGGPRWRFGDRKSTRLNSSHRCISYAVFCLKKKTQKKRKNI